MRLFLRSLLCLTLFSFVLTSCSTSDSDSDDASTPDAPVGKFVAKIDGVLFETDGNAMIYNNTIMVGATIGTENISVLVAKSASVGTYDVKGTIVGYTPDAEVNYTPDSKHLYSSTFALHNEKVGTVTITEVDQANKTVSGTFSSKTVDGNGGAVQITSGAFNKIPYTSTAPSSLSAKVDGKAFTATVTVGTTTDGVIGINGQALNGSEIIVLAVPTTITPGTYEMIDPFEELTTSKPYASYSKTPDMFISSSGTMVITMHNTTTKRIEGTFSFTANTPMGGPSRKLTEGKFAVTYR